MGCYISRPLFALIFVFTQNLNVKHFEKIHLVISFHTLHSHPTLSLLELSLKSILFQNEPQKPKISKNVMATSSSSSQVPVQVGSVKP